MTDKHIFYEYEGDTLKVPVEKQKEFENRVPSAKMMLTYKGENYKVPLSELRTFARRLGGDNLTYSVLNEKKEYVPEESTDKYLSFEGPSLGESTVKASGSAGIRTAKRGLNLLHALSSGYVYNDPETGAAKQTEDIDTQLKDETNTFRNASILAGETADRLSREADPTGGQEGFIDLMAKGQVGKALQKGLVTTIESLPQTLSAYNPITMGLNAAAMAAENYVDSTLENPEMEKWKRATYAIGTAAFEQAVEKFADPLFKYIGGGKAAKGLTEEAAKKLINDVTRQATDDMAQRIFAGLGKIGVNVLKDAGGEGAEEVITSFGNDALGEALDAIDGDKDFGIRAQWQKMKEENPDADMWDFAKAKAKEYADAFIGGALSGGIMSGPTQLLTGGADMIHKEVAIRTIENSRAIGSGLDLQNSYDVNEKVKEVTNNAIEAFKEEGKPEISDEFFAGLTSDEAFALSESEDITPAQRAALENIASVRAMEEGLNEKLDNRINEKINEITAIINESTEDGSVVTGNYNGTSVFVKGGVVKDGSITLPNGDNGPVIIINETTGEKTTVQSNEISNAVSLNAEQYSNSMANQWRTVDAQTREEARNTMSPMAKLVAVQPFVGKKILVDLSNGIKEVYVQQITENGEVTLKGKKGDLGGQSVITLKSGTFYDSIHRDDTGNPVITEVKEDEAEELNKAEEQPAEPETTNVRHGGLQDYREQVVTILINGKPVEVEVTGQDNVADRINYEYIDENGNRRSGGSDIASFESAIINTPEAEIIEETVDEVPAEEPTPVETIAEEKIELEPKEINWDNLFEQDKDAYLAELQNQFGEETLDILNEEIETAQSEIDSIGKAKTKNQNERIANRKKKAALQERINTLNGMVAQLNTPTEAEVTEEAIAETPVAEEATENVAETPVAETTTEPVIEEAVTSEPAVEESVAEEPVVEQTEETVEPIVEQIPEPVAEPAPVVPVAPNPVANPVDMALEEEKKLRAKLERTDMNRNEKRDWAYKYGKKIADMFATREEYGAYEAVAESLGVYDTDFETGVDDSFANRLQTKEGGRLFRGVENNDNFVEQLEDKQNNEREQFEYSDEFRGLQEESARMSEQLVSEKDGVQRATIRGLVGRIGGTLQRELDRAISSRGYKLRNVVNESKGTSFDIVENVDGKLFHDIFEIVRTYLPNGELVDLHDSYDDATCYITSDGLAGFAVTNDGNLISVFSLYGASKKGFLGAIKDLITEAGATHLDGYNSQLQPLAEIYSKVFGWKVASMMDYNMEYDHDNIAKNHGMPQVAFMVNTDEDIETKHFDKDQYDEAVAYQLEQVEAIKQRKSKEISRESEINSVSLQNNESTEEHTTSFERPDNKGQLHITEGREVSFEDFLNFNPINEREGESDRQRNIREGRFFDLFGKLTSDDKLNFYLFAKEYLNYPSGALKESLNRYTNELRKNGSSMLADFAEQFINDELIYREGISAKAVALHNLLSGVPYNIGAIEHMFMALNKDKYNEKLFNRALKLAKRFGVTVSFITRDSNGDFYNALGEYNTTTNAIAIDANLLTKGNEAELCQTILHELIHSVVARATAIMSGRVVGTDNKFIDPNSLPKNVIEGVKTLQSVYDTIKNDDTFKNEYGYKDLDEMVSEISNPKFRALLKAKNVWKKFIDGVCKILGIKEKGSTQSDALTEIESALDKILSSAEQGELTDTYANFVGKLADGYTLEDLQNIPNGNIKSLLARNVMLREDVDPTYVEAETARETYDRLAKNKWQEFVRQFQNAYQPVENAYKAIQQETGDIPIEDYENYLLIQNQSSSRERVEIDTFSRRFYSPIIDQTNKIISQILESRGLDIEDKSNRAAVYKEVLNYLIAKHGLERNEYYQTHKKRLMTEEEQKPFLDEAKKEYEEKVNQINSDTTLTEAERKLQLREAADEYDAMKTEIKTREVPDMRDYSGLTALYGLDSKEFKQAEDETRKEIAKFESLVDTKDLWAKINAATNRTLKHSYESGMISRKQYEEISKMFKFYVPLRGFDENTAEDVYSYARFEGNRFNPAVRKAKGRTSLADDPIATIKNMAESEITQGNKNKAKQALYNYILNRPVIGPDGKQMQNSLMQIEDVWYVVGKDENGNDIHQIAAPDHEHGQTYEEFENKMKALASEGKAYKSKKGGVDIGMRFQKPANRDAHYVYLKINGVDKAIYINGDPKAADAINGTYKQKTTPKAKIKIGDREITVDIAAIQRNISSTFTNYSLEFTARNYFRDLIYSHINIDNRESDPEYRKKFRQNWRSNNLGTMMTMLKAYRAGEYDSRPLSEEEASFVEFMENGGQTGYTIINSVESHKAELENAIKRMQDGVEKGGLKDSATFKATLGGIELLNEASELVTRFAAFKTSRDMGRSILKSINDAKEVTVNFNTKGAQDGTGVWGRIAQYLGWSKYFFNASIQGVDSIASMAKANKLKFGTTVGSIMATGFMMPVIVSAISALLGGDDEEEYWNIPEYDRQNNFCIPLGNGKYAKIPLPIGFREMYALGDMIAAMAFDKKFTRDSHQIGLDMANKVASILLPINPLESSANGLSIWASAGNFILPSSMQFITQNWTNMDWKGAPLQKEYTYNANDPQWMKAYASNPLWMKSLSKWCNENIGAGDMKGLDWSPEKLDNTLSNLLGGVYSIIKKTGRGFTTIWNGITEEKPFMDIVKETASAAPLTNVAFGSGINSDERFITDAYYDMKEYYDDRLRYIKDRAGKFGYDLDDVFLKEKGKHHPKMLELYTNDTFDFMQEWYKGNEELKELQKKVKDLEKEIASKENPSEVLVQKLLIAKAKLEAERREFVNDMLEFD